MYVYLSRVLAMVSHMRPCLSLSFLVENRHEAAVCFYMTSVQLQNTTSWRLVEKTRTLARTSRGKGFECCWFRQSCYYHEAGTPEIEHKNQWMLIIYYTSLNR